MGLIGTGHNPGRDHVTSVCATLRKQAEQRAKCLFSIWLGWLIFNNCFHITHEADLHSAFFVIYLQVLVLQHVLYVTLCMVTCACSCMCTSICMCMHVFAFVCTEPRTTQVSAHRHRVYLLFVFTSSLAGLELTMRAQDPFPLPLHCWDHKCAQ